jgi:hypothetical protein
MTRISAFFFALAVMATTVRSQQVSVNASVDVQTVSIGDWIQYSVTINAPKDLSVTVPQLRDTIGSFEIVRQDSLAGIENNGGMTLTKKFVITKFDSGNFYIPPYTIQFMDESGKRQSAQSNAIPVVVRGIEVDTTQSIRDVKPQLTVPLTAEEIAFYVGIALLLAAAGYGVYYYVRKKRRNAGAEPEEAKPAIPPHVLALVELDELESKGLWQRGEFKIFYSEATEIVRRYFERRYGIMALEMTSGEVMQQLERFSIEDEIRSSIRNFLTGADLVKFAKHQPAAGENENVIPNGRQIVEGTIPPEPVEPQESVQQEEAVRQ